MKKKVINKFREEQDWSKDTHNHIIKVKHRYKADLELATHEKPLIFSFR